MVLRWFPPLTHQHHHHHNPCASEKAAIERAQGRITNTLVGAPSMAYSFRMHVFLEVVAVAKFEAESLFVTYDVVLPHSGWTWPDKGAQTSGSRTLATLTHSLAPCLQRPI